MRKYLFRHPWILVFAILTGGVVQGLIVSMDLIAMRIIDAIVMQNQDVFFSYIGTAMLVVGLIFVFTAVFARMFMLYSFKTQYTIKKDFFDGVLATKISDFQRESSSKYISVLNNDIKVISDKYFALAPQLAKDALAVAMSIAAIAIINPVNAVITAVTCATPLLAPLIFGKKLARAQIDASTGAIAFNQKARDYLSGFEVIKTFGAEKNIRPRFLNVARILAKAQYRGGTVVSDVGALTMAITMAVLFLNYFVAGFFVFRGDITVGGVVAVVGLSSGVLGPIGMVSNHISSIKSTKAIGERVLDMMKQKDTKPREVKISALKSGIEFKNVSFAYEVEDSNKDAEKTLALKNVSYTFAKGGKYAIVGASGSGKSTLTKLIMGYYDNYEGDIMLNDNNIRDVDRESLYNVISVLHQNVFLLDDTLKNNITLYNDYDESRYRAAIEKSNLVSVEAGLPNGSNTVLGEGGNTISGGERQRVSIARSILKGSEVMIFDEAATGLDNIIAHDIEKSIVEMEELTCIFVTHRYSKDILEKCDGILVMRNGELIEQGSFDELYERKGYFYSLYTIN